MPRQFGMHGALSRGGPDRRLYLCGMRKNILGQNCAVSRGSFRDDELSILVITNTYENEDATKNQGDSKDTGP